MAGLPGLGRSAVDPRTRHEVGTMPVAIRPGAGYAIDQILIPQLRQQQADGEIFSV